MKTKTRHYGDYSEERCPWCGKFVADADAFSDRLKRSDENSPIHRFCNEAHADMFANRAHATLGKAVAS
jgi:hypothetical protein